MDYNEILCTSIDTIVKKRIEDLAFDKTIICTILDDSEKNKGKYLVTNNVIKFYAYSQDVRYRKNDSVYVLIPNGDYNSSQKTIISKYSNNNNDQPLTYMKPFDSFVAIETLTNMIEMNEFGLTANDTEKTKVQIGRFQCANSQQYTSLGIKISLKTLLQRYELISGSFGLEIQIKQNNNIISIFNFTEKDIFGNPYAFSSYEEQEITFLIPKGKEELIIEVYFYQSSDFKDINKKLIPISAVDNLFVKNFQLFLGNDIRLKPDNSFEIYSNKLTYGINDNNIIINSIWYNKDKNNRYLGYEKNNWVIKWYKMKRNSWEEIISKEQITQRNFQLDTNLQNEYIKAILFYDNKEYQSNILTIKNISLKDNITDINKNSFINIILKDNAYINYPLYGSDNRLINQKDAYLERKISLNIQNEIFDVPEEEFFNNAKIEWQIPTENSMLKSFVDAEGKSKATDTKDFSFLIKSIYNSSYINNTIRCIIKYNGQTYIATINFTFQAQGNNGTDYTLVIYSETENNAFIENPITLKGILYDPSNTPIDADIYWNDSQNPSSSYTITEYKNDNAIIKASALVEQNNRLINISSYYLVPRTNSKSYYALVPSTIIYNSSGVNPKYYRGQFKILDKYTNEEIPVSWEIESNNIRHNLKIDGDILKVPPMFIAIEGNDNIPIFLIAKDSKHNEIWRQPIYISQNAYDFRLLNQWNEKISIDGDGDGNYILSAMLGAGHKDNSNKFTGVLMGDIGTADGHKQDAGLYGFKNGLQTFELNTDGTAILGNDKQGQIIFDGNNGILKSGNYKKNVSGMNIDLSKGHIDAYDFKLSSQNLKMNSNPDDNGFYFDLGPVENHISLSKKGELSIISKNLSITPKGCSINIGNNFVVDTDGNLTSTTINNQIEGVNSTITQTAEKLKTDFSNADKVLQSSIEQNATKIEAKVSNKSTGGSCSWELNSNNWLVKVDESEVFKIDSTGAQITGKITANSGAIGGFYLENNHLTSVSGTTWANTAGTVYIGPEGIGLNETFWVDKLGNMTAKSAIITGKITAESLNLADGVTISAGKISGTLSSGQIATGAITTDKIAAGAITTNKIAANAITANMIDVEHLYVKHLRGADGDFTGELTAQSLTIKDNATVGGVIKAKGSDTFQIPAKMEVRERVFVYDGWQIYRNADDRTSIGSTPAISSSPTLSGKYGAWYIYDKKEYTWQGYRYHLISYSGGSGEISANYWVNEIALTNQSDIDIAYKTEFIESQSKTTVTTGMNINLNNATITSEAYSGNSPVRKMSLGSQSSNVFDVINNGVSRFNISWNGDITATGVAHFSTLIVDNLIVNNS